jgi:hypothetical protein
MKCLQERKTQLLNGTMVKTVIKSKLILMAWNSSTVTHFHNKDHSAAKVSITVSIY